MLGPRLRCLLLVLAVLASLAAAAPAAAQYASPQADPSLEELKYRAIYGRPRPPQEQSEAEGGDASPSPSADQSPPARYRFADDPWLNPPGSQAPGSAPAAGAGQGGAAAPSGPHSLGEPSTPLPRREIQVRVLDDRGQPVPLARVSLSTRQQPFFRVGLTDEQGGFTFSVPCYRPGGQDMLSHNLRVSNSWGSTERLLLTRRGSCATAERVSVVLHNPNRLQEMMERYRRRQELYEQDEQEQKEREEKEQEALSAKGQGKGEAAPGKK